MLVALIALPFMFCAAPARVVGMRAPAGATHAGAGSVTLAGGASFEVDGSAQSDPKTDGERLLAGLRRTDRVQLCFGPPERFVDAGRGARMAIAGVVRTGDSVYTVAYPPAARSTR